jgi:uncharacterized protein YbjQ (UPF0145 family)
MKLAHWLILALVPACTEAYSTHQEHGSETAEAHGAHGGEHDETPVSREAMAHVLILEANHVDRPTEMLGVVDVHEPVHSVNEALDELREHAVRLGADAVLGVEFHHGDGHGDPTHLSGMAVRFRDLFEHRAYDVLGQINVVEAMGGEEAALAELRRRARDMHADLVINIGFEHGDASSDSTRLTGTAIRYR